MIKNVKILLLPGGTMPTFGTDQSAGLDVWPRGLVSLKEADPTRPYLRKLIFDFKSKPSSPDILNNTIENRDGYSYILNPGESASFGIGFIVEMPTHLYFDLRPRSGIAIKSEVILLSDLVPIDSDFRGEPCATLKNLGTKPYTISPNKAIAQIVFHYKINIKFNTVNNYNDLTVTERGSGSLGHTDLKNKNGGKNEQ